MVTRWWAHPPVFRAEARLYSPHKKFLLHVTNLEGKFQAHVVVFFFDCEAEAAESGGEDEEWMNSW